MRQPCPFVHVGHHAAARAMACAKTASGSETVRIMRTDPAPERLGTAGRSSAIQKTASPTAS